MSDYNSQMDLIKEEQQQKYLEHLANNKRNMVKEIPPIFVSDIGQNYHNRFSKRRSLRITKKNDNPQK
jgi:hypothetical protein